VQVYNTNPTLEAERAKLREVDEQVSQAESNWRPSIDAQGYTGKLYQDTPNNPLVVPAGENLTTHSVGVQVTQPLFRGFRTINGISAAKKQVDAERATLESTEQQVFLDTATAFLDVLRDQSIVDLNSEYSKVLDGRLGETRDRFSHHDVTRTDIDQAMTRLKRSEATRMQASANLDAHRAVYYHLTGEMPGKLESPRIDLPPLRNLDEAISLTRNQNPSIRAADSNEDEAKEEVSVSKGSLLPEVSLVGSAQRQWGVSTFVPGQQDTAQVLVQVTIPLYRAGTDYSKARAAMETVTERRMRLEDTRRQAEQIVIAAWQNLATLRDVIVADKTEVEASEKALHGVKTELPAGTRDTLDVLNAEQEYMDARIALVQAHHDEAVMILQIRAAIGALTAEALNLPVSYYDPKVHYDAASGKLIGFDTPSGEKETQDEDLSEDKVKIEPTPSKQSNLDNVPIENVQADETPIDQPLPTPVVAVDKGGVIAPTLVSDETASANPIDTKTNDEPKPETQPAAAVPHNDAQQDVPAPASEKTADTSSPALNTVEPPADDAAKENTSDNVSQSDETPPVAAVSNIVTGNRPANND